MMEFENGRIERRKRSDDSSDGDDGDNDGDDDSNDDDVGLSIES